MKDVERRVLKEAERFGCGRRGRRGRRDEETRAERKERRLSTPEIYRKTPRKSHGMQGKRCGKRLVAG